MGVAPSIKASTVNPSDVLKHAKVFFEPQLAALQLGIEQIESQTLEELEQSLERVNIALANPNSFGIYDITMTSGVTIANIETRGHIGILPILLERKKLILDRINAIKGSEKIESLRDSINKIADETVKSKLEKQLTDLELESQKWRKQSEELEQAQLQAQAKMQTEVQKVKILQMRSQVWLSLFERESVATIVGSVLLIIITGCLLLAMFRGTATSEIINNSFLVILGYFFGQTVSRNSSKTKEQD